MSHGNSIQQRVLSLRRIPEPDDNVRRDRSGSLGLGLQDFGGSLLRLRAAFELLLQGLQYAEASQRDIWDFAIEIEDLRAVGLTRNDLRWMVHCGWIEHARELSGHTAKSRSFAQTNDLLFAEDSCFIVTEQGALEADKLANNSIGGEPNAGTAHPQRVDSTVNGTVHGALNGSVHNAVHEEAQSPHWDPERNRLYVGSEVVKEFKLPCPNQGTILMAFEEEGWPPRIDDPLPPCPQIDSKYRLRYTIKSLNKSQKTRLIRFMGDGSGLGITWEFI